MSDWTAVADTRFGKLEYLKADQYVGRSIELYGEFSRGETDTFKGIVRDGDWVLEVGANIGAHTLYLSQLAGKTGRVLAMEPQRIVYEILLRNMVRNECLNVAPIHAGAGEDTAIASIPVMDYGKAGNFGGVSMVQGPGEPTAVIPIDKMNIPQLRLIKIDAEGMEVPILRGAAATIARCRPVLYVENDRHEHSAELIRLIESFGYRMWWDLTPLYEEENFRGNPDNVFPGIVSINMLCIPREIEVEDATLPPVLGPDDDWRLIYSDTGSRPAPQANVKRAAVFRLGAYGDALWASSILPHLKNQGYRVTVYTGDRGMEVLQHDPHIDEFVHVRDGQIPLADLGDYVARERPRYDRFIQLVESVETHLLAHPNSWRYAWPQDVLHAQCNVNYLEFIHDVAQVPREYHQRFYPSREEAEWARQWREEIECLIVLATAGSGVQKWYPRIGELAQALLETHKHVHVLALGEDRGAKWPANPRLHRPQWTIRQAMTMATIADMVVGQETGLLNACALEPNRKVVLLSHSTAENLTKHWVNTISVWGSATCYPCHRMIFGWQNCNRDEKTRAAACQAAISLPALLNTINNEVPAARRQERQAA